MHFFICPFPVGRYSISIEKLTSSQIQGVIQGGVNSETKVEKPRDIVITVLSPKIRELDQLYIAVQLKLTIKSLTNCMKRNQWINNNKQLNHNGGNIPPQRPIPRQRRNCCVEMLQRMLSERMSGGVRGRLVRVWTSR